GGHISLIGAEPAPPYERPPLSKSYLRDETPFEEALVRPESFYAANDIALLPATLATDVDVAGRRVTLDSGESVPFDRLLLSTGARNRRFPIPGLDLDGVYSLRSVEDARRIKAEARPGRTVAIAGMGFIRPEVA